MGAEASLCRSVEYLRGSLRKSTWNGVIFNGGITPEKRTHLGALTSAPRSISRRTMRSFPPELATRRGRTPSRTALKILPRAVRGFEIVSFVRCQSRRASSLKVWLGAGSARGCADSSPVCEDGNGIDVCDIGVSWSGVVTSGVCEPVVGSD